MAEAITAGGGNLADCPVRDAGSEAAGGVSYGERAAGTALARSYVKAAPERLVWGSDWPHPSAKQPPDDAGLFDLLAEWAPEEKVRHRILVSNPEVLYGFPN